MQKPKRKLAVVKPAALPPIPRDTVEGARVHGILEALNAVDAMKGEFFCLQDDELEALAESLRVPIMFLACHQQGAASHYITDEALEEYRTWRLRLAAKAVA